jgi:peptidoglycan/xylan/chitin deacetylase (PgdA/CDA1 family)
MLRSPRLLKAALKALHLTGLDTVCAPVTRGAGVIFMLHHVAPEPTAQFSQNRILTITPDFLETAIGHVIEAGFDIVSLDEACARMAATDGNGGERAAPQQDRPFACFTLDDGYRDNRDYAYPIFKSYGAPFTVYVASDFADGRGELWWLTLEDVVRAADCLTVEIEGRPRTFQCRDEVERTKAFDAVYWWLRTKPDADVREFVRQLAEAHGIDPLARCRELVMNWDELRELAADPLVSVGAHTVSHAAVARLPADEARQEISDSIARLEGELGRPCRHFSFPYGDSSSVSPRDIEITRELGLQSAVTTGKGFVASGAARDMQCLSRVSLNGDYQDVRYLKVLLSGLPFALWNGAARLLPRRQAREDALPGIS